MARVGIGLALGATLLIGGGVNAAEVVYDNPGVGEAPCVIVENYNVVENRAEATVQNICARSVELRFCFQYLNADDEAGAECFVGPVRPGTTAQAQSSDAPVRITGPLYEWRFFE